MGRPKEHDEATRERLLDAAEHLSATHGWEALTVRRIAEEAGTSTRAVYALFGSKQGLEQALHEAMFTRLRDLLQACERTRRPAPRHRRPVARLPPVGRGAPGALRPGHAPLRRPALAAALAEGLAVSREALGELRHAVRRCHDAGLLLGDRDPEDVVTHMRAIVHGLAEFENLGLLAPDPEAHWLAAVAAQLDGYVQADAAAA